MIKKMFFMTRVRAHFWNIDPGYLNLKLAFKTVLGIILTLLILRGHSLLTQLMAAIACGFSMQGVGGKTWGGKALHILVFDVIYFSAFVLGLSVRDYPILTAATLVTVGFFANYIRRFNLENSFAPLMVWILCFLATILPIPSAHEAYTHLGGLLLGLVVAAVVTLLIFPEDYPLLLIKNSNRFFKTLSAGFYEVRRYLLGYEKAPGDFTQLRFVQIKKELTELMDINQTLQHSLVVQNKQHLNEILVHQYGLLSAYSLMIEAYQTLLLNPQYLPRMFRLDLIRLNKKLANIFALVRMHQDWKITPQLDLCDVNLSSLTKAVPQDAEIILALLNLKLGFAMAKKHLRHLLCGDTYA